MFSFKNARTKWKEQAALREMAGRGRVLPPTLDDGVPCEYISLPALDIPTLAAAYVAGMEAEKTEDWCRCEWLIHPDDVEVINHRCRQCNRNRDDAVHDVGLSTPANNVHTFRGKRKRRGEQAWDCPVHTREGFLIYFFEWVFTRAKN